MDEQAIEQAARLLVAARRSGQWLAAMPEQAKPVDPAQAHAVQDATVAALGERVAGWKVSLKDGAILRGVILGSRLLASPAVLAAKLVPPLGIEAEIAFRFEHALPPREHDYTREEIAAAAIAVAGIEIVASRYQSYQQTPFLDRLADCMSNGAFVVGTARPDWLSFDLPDLEATLTINGQVVARRRGGHPAGDPILPAIALVNALRTTSGVAAGQVITTGTYLDLWFARPTDQVLVTFTGFGSAEILLDGEP
jgi:2-keto-4-pentenoate hydratase